MEGQVPNSDGPSAPVGTNQPLNMSHLVGEMEKMFAEIQVLKQQLHNAHTASFATESAHMHQKHNFYNKPKPFTGKQGESVEAFIGHMDLYIEQVPPVQRYGVAVSYLVDEAYSWFAVMKMDNNPGSWEDIKHLLLQRFAPINKHRAARDKLASCAHSSTVSAYNETFLRIIMDLPKITADETIDRYMRGLKRYIRTELCTKEYTRLNLIMADSLRIEASKGQFYLSNSASQDKGTPRSDETSPMDISNVQTDRELRKARDVKDKSCFYCHKKDCRIGTCPLKKAADAKRENNISNINMDVQKKENPTQDK